MTFVGRKSNDRVAILIGLALPTVLLLTLAMPAVSHFMKVFLNEAQNIFGDFVRTFGAVFPVLFLMSVPFILLLLAVKWVAHDSEEDVDQVLMNLKGYVGGLNRKMDAMDQKLDRVSHELRSLKTVLAAPAQPKLLGPTLLPPMLSTRTLDLPEAWPQKPLEIKADPIRLPKPLNPFKNILDYTD